MAEHMRYCTNMHCKEFQIPQIFNKGKTCPGCQRKTKTLKPGEDLPTQQYVDSTKGLTLLPSSTSSTKSSQCVLCQQLEDGHVEIDGLLYCKGSKPTVYLPSSSDQTEVYKPMLPVGWQHSRHACINCDFEASEHSVDGVCPTSDENHVTWFEDSFSRTQQPQLSGTAAYFTRTSGPSQSSSKPTNSQPMTFISNCDIKDCPVAPAGLRVNVPFSLYQKWVFLAGHFNVEWIAYLTGTLVPSTTNDKGEVEPAHYLLDEDGMYFPQQLATGAHVDAEHLSDGERPNTIASIHSHVQMLAFFSDTDEKHFSHDIELVVNAMGKMDCVTRVRLECGRYQRVKSKVDIIAAAPLTSVLKDLKSKLVAYNSTSYSKSPSIQPLVLTSPTQAKPQSNNVAKRDNSYNNQSDERDEILEDPGVKMAMRYIIRRTAQLK